MKKKDQGLLHYLSAMLLLSCTMTALLCLMLLSSVRRLKAYLEDSMTQAGLAALLIEPYTYGRSGELVFESPQKVETVYLAYLEEALGTEENRGAVGIAGEVELTEFIVYELTTSGIREYEREGEGSYRELPHAVDETVYAPDGTEIISGAVYARIRLPVRVWENVTVEIERQNCVDIVGG